MEHDALWNAMEELGAPGVYVRVLKRLYDGRQAKVGVDKVNKSSPIKRGMKQGDPVSPTMMNAVFEVMMRRLKEES